MSQFNFGVIDPATKSGVDLAADLNAWRTAIHTTHSGNSRPAYVLAGQLWLNTTANPWILNIFDGTDDIPVGLINTTTNTFTPSTLAIGDGTVTLAMLATQAANTVLANVTAGNASPAAISLAANKFLARPSTGNIQALTVSDAALTLLAQSTAALMRSNGLGLGSLSVQDSDNVNITGGTITGVSGVGGWDHIASATAAASSTLPFSFTSGQYRAFKLLFCGLRTSANADVFLRLNGQTGGASHNYTSRSLRAATATAYAGNSAGLRLVENMASSNTQGINGQVQLDSPKAGGRRASATWELGWGVYSGAVQSNKDDGFGFVVSSLDALSSLVLYPSTGNFSEGEVHLFGVTNT